MPSPIPRWTERVHLSIAFPVRAAFPELGAGRRPRLCFSRPARRSLALPPAGSLDRLRGLCHEAPARPVAQPHRSSASEPFRHLLGLDTSSNMVDDRYKAHPNLTLCGPCPFIGWLCSAKMRTPFSRFQTADTSGEWRMAVGWVELFARPNSGNPCSQLLGLVRTRPNLRIPLFATRYSRPFVPAARWRPSFEP